MSQHVERFTLKDKVAVITGGGGILGTAIAQGLGQAGAKIAVTDIFPDKAQETAEALQKDGIEARHYLMDVMDKTKIEESADQIYGDFGQVDILINGAGGNNPKATTSDDLQFFDMPLDALQWVINLNLMGGAILPSQVFGKRMVDLKEGASIINISSMSAFQPLTRVLGYSAAKAAVSNFTQWLAVHFAEEYNPKIRVNAIAPGFFLTDQNRYLLTDKETGKPTERGQKIINNTPQRCYGEPEDLVGATVWLASPSARFVTGIILPIDGGFSAFSGV